MSVTAHSDWGSASDAIRRQLDKKCKEPRVLHFNQNDFYEMTYNDSALGFSQSQIAMLQKMPTVEEISSLSPVKLLLAPSGCKAIPEGVEQPDDLLHHGWRLCICWRDCKAHDSHISSWDKGLETSIWLLS